MGKKFVIKFSSPLTLIFHFTEQFCNWQIFSFTNNFIFSSKLLKHFKLIKKTHKLRWFHLTQNYSFINRFVLVKVLLNIKSIAWIKMCLSVFSLKTRMTISIKEKPNQSNDIWHTNINKHKVIAHLLFNIIEKFERKVCLILSQMNQIQDAYCWRTFTLRRNYWDTYYRKHYFLSLRESIF